MSRKIIALLILSLLLGTTVMAQEGEAISHRVDWADTLDEIGQFYDVSTLCIAEANDLLDHPNDLEYASTLTIPADCRPYDEIESIVLANGGFSMDDDDQGGGPTIPADGLDYRAGWGDTLDVIGIDYDISVACIVGANNLINANELAYAQVIFLPGDCDPYDPIESIIIANMEDTREFSLADSGLGRGGGGGQSLTTPGTVDPAADLTEEDDGAEDAAALSSQTLSDEVYIIQWGDSLNRIAARFNASAFCIQRSNAIYNPDMIYAGNQLLITAACRLA
jgi:LysM repeat protein